MLWMSLRFGIGNLGPVFGLGLLTLFAAVPLGLGQHSTPHAAVPDLLTVYGTSAPIAICELSGDTPLRRYTI
jgi:hypothetical protein